MKRNKELIFLQEYGTYPNQILVCAGINNKKTLYGYLKKIKARVDFAKWVIENFDGWQENLKEKHAGAFCYNTDIQGTVLMLRGVKDSWEFWEVLMHELHHAVQLLAKERMMNDEPEGQAYLFEFLFRSIRRKLQGIDKP